MQNEPSNTLKGKEFIFHSWLEIKLREKKFSIVGSTRIYDILMEDYYFGNIMYVVNQSFSTRYKSGDSNSQSHD